MLRVSLLLGALAGTAAFAPSPAGPGRRLAAADDGAAPPEPAAEAAAPAPAAPPASAAPPPANVNRAWEGGQNSFDSVDRTIFPRNPVLDSVALAGDASFDPFTLATDKATLLSHRSAELRHSRLAMLAVVGWPISELVQPKAAELAGLSNALASQTQAPSVLNGGLGNVPAPFWLAAILGAALLEQRSLEFEKAGKLPGDLGFDPLGMNSPKMAGAEVTNGRVAMLAITGFAIQEAVYHASVVNETPFFFHPAF
ncbi:chlorophyll a/b-binding protein domain-containing protein [Pelagophyceae sp. CCMP2097]|nr:chlorophyll a/b-binding protein domain-containing protein [Pelagophyceae sp. CCMP2097]